jgi:hypothetical protein
VIVSLKNHDLSKLREIFTYRRSVTVKTAGPSRFVALTKYYLGYHIREDRWARRVARREEEVVHIGLWWRTLNKRGTWIEIDLDMSMILKWVFKKLAGSVEWNDLAKNWDKFRALVKVVINFRVP